MFILKDIKIFDLGSVFYNCLIFKYYILSTDQVLLNQTISIYILSLYLVFDGIVLYLMAEASNIWVAYVGYLLFRAFFQMMITVAR